MFAVHRGFLMPCDVARVQTHVAMMWLEVSHNMTIAAASQVWQSICTLVSSDPDQ